VPLLNFDLDTLRTTFALGSRQFLILNFKIMLDQELFSRVTTNSKVMVGKPVIKDTRLTIEYILNLLAHDVTVVEILAEYEGLIEADIRACLLFAS
jgi:uncharacterized protein (DUF433 family)